MKSKTVLKPVIYWTMLGHLGWELPLAATETGLCCVGGDGESIEDLQKRTASLYSKAEWIRDEQAMAPYCTEIKEYLNGKRESFSIRSEASGTPFQRAVWNALLDIPYGSTSTYSGIAEAIGKPAAVRAVGAAIGANPNLITVPCHRVVGKNGALTGYRGGLAMKSKLLELELR